MWATASSSRAGQGARVLAAFGRRGILASFVLLALGMGLAFGLVGWLAFDRLGVALVRWHAEPVFHTLIEAEQMAVRATNRGRRGQYYGEDLAERLGWQFLVGKQVPADWAALPEGSHVLDSGKAFVCVAVREGVPYALNGRTDGFAAIRVQFTWLFLLCAGVGLAVAVWLAGILARREAQLRAYGQREYHFTGDVSHELRTPLTVMQGGLEILAQRLEGTAEGAALAPTLARLERTTARMTATVQTLLALARRPENLAMDDLDMTAMLLALLHRYEAERGIRLVLEGPCPARGEGGRTLVHAQLAQGVLAWGEERLAAIIIENLLDNALHYTQNGLVWVRLHGNCLEMGNAGAIPPGVDVFAHGVRAVPRSDAGRGGYGFGLSLAARACERMGWGIACHGGGDGGSVFCVRLVPARMKEN